MTSDYIYDAEYKDLVFETDAIKYKNFENCVFHNCDFTACHFQTVAFIDCTFLNCNFKDAKINHVSLRDVWFTGCNLTNVNFAMTDQVIYEFNFKDCLLDYTKFYALKLRKMQFINCSLIATDFMGCNLTEALFDNCNLRRAVFIDTIAHKADFSTSYDYTIDPEKNKLKKAVFAAEGLKGLLEKYDLLIK